MACVDGDGNTLTPCGRCRQLLYEAGGRALLVDGTPILDIKPYQPSFDRVEHPESPAWCAAWPHSVETSGAFDWASVFPD